MRASTWQRQQVSWTAQLEWRERADSRTQAQVEWKVLAVSMALVEAAVPPAKVELEGFV
jgi:hypothetical protein